MHINYTPVESTDSRIIGVKINTLGQELSNLIYCLYFICDTEVNSHVLENELDGVDISFSIGHEIIILIDKGDSFTGFVKFSPNEAHINIFNTTNLTKIGTAYIDKGQLYYNPDLSIN